MQILGISIDNQKAYFCKVKLSKKEKKILQVESFSLDEPTHIKNFLKIAQTTPTIFTISSKNVLMQEHLLPKKGEKLIDQIIDFQIQSLTFLEPNNSITTTKQIKNQNAQTLVHSFTIAKQELKKHIEIFKPYNFDPEIITQDALSLASYVKFLSPACQDAFIVNVQELAITICVMHQGLCQKYFVLETHLLDLFKALCKDKNKAFPSMEIQSLARQLDLAKLKKQNFPHLYTALQELLNQIACCIFSMHQNFGKKPIIFLGNCRSFLELEKCIEEKCKDYLDTNISLYNPIDWQEYGSCIGAAFDYFSCPDFRKKEFFSVKKRNSIAQKNIFLTLISTFVCIGALLSLHWTLDKKTNLVCDYYAYQISQKNPEMAKMIFQENDLSVVALRWEKVLEIFSKKNPYILTVPNVSQTLSFIFKHPLVQSPENDKIQITNINYELEKMPLIGAMKTPYVAKLALTITTKNHLKQKSFIQSIQEQSFIDDKTDPTIEENEHGANISFYLKSKEF